MKRNFSLLCAICLLLISSVMFSACDIDGNYYALQYDKTSKIYEVKSSQSLVSVKEGTDFSFDVVSKNGYDISASIVGVASRSTGTAYTSTQFSADFSETDKKWVVKVPNLSENITLVISNLPLPDRVVNFYKDETSKQLLGTYNLDENNKIILNLFDSDVDYDKVNRITYYAEPTRWYYRNSEGGKTYFNITESKVETENLDLYNDLWDELPQVGIDFTNIKSLNNGSGHSELLQDKEGNARFYKEGNVYYYTYYGLNSNIYFDLLLKTVTDQSRALVFKDMKGVTLNLNEGSDYGVAEVPENTAIKRVWLDSSIVEDGVIIGLA